MWSMGCDNEADVCYVMVPNIFARLESPSISEWVGLCILAACCLVLTSPHAFAWWKGRG